MPKILLLSSNPRRDLNLEREIADLTTAVQRLGKFEVRLGLGVRSQELPDLLIEHSAEFVHFCGHGAGEQGLVFQDEKGREQLVSTELLARIFNTFSDEINCVVLNACESDRQAEAIVQYINYVVGMNQTILDRAALMFAVGFYKGLAAGKSIEKSYELGCIAIQIWSEQNSQSTQSREYRKAKYAGEVVQPTQPNLPEHLNPVLRKKSMLLSSLTETNLILEVPPSSASPNLPPDFEEAREPEVENEVPSTQSNLVPEVPSSSASSNLPPGFEEVIREEIDRKEYKDRAREAYDNFGQFSTQQATSLTKSEYEQRKILLEKVKSFWIKGFLQPSVEDNPAMRLDLKDRPDAIADLTQGIEALSVELDASYEELRETRIYEEMGQGRTLLILGDPGAGKTIALLQLAQRLIERSEQNLSLPIPVVFNLSSWANEGKSLVDWLINELLEKYQVPKSLSEHWITQQQLILLLDGLDEVLEDYRNDCVRALNKFIGDYRQTEIAVCTRVKDYEALTERLQLSSALCLQPLSPDQVHQFLDNVGGSLAGLKVLLKNDAELEQFAQTPLIANFMSVAYQGWSAQELIPQLTTPDRHQHLFDTYIDRRLEQGAASKYSKDNVLRWLSWLASRMVREKQTIFLIEKMQPTWLNNGREERAYRITAFLIGGLSFGLIGWLIAWLIAWVIDKQINGPIYGLLCGLFCGLFFGPIGGLITGLPIKISPLEKPRWSWQRAKSRFVREFSTGVYYGLIAGLSGGLTGLSLKLIQSGGKLGELVATLSSALSGALILGLILGLIFGLGSGLDSSEIVQRTVPNQGIRTSLRNCIFIGLIVGLSLGLSFGLIGKWILGLSFGLSFGLISALKYGGAACIQHFSLRWMLHQKNRIPRNYAKFLDFISKRRLMKRVGGGYVFFHRMLLEHFARMNFN